MILYQKVAICESWYFNRRRYHVKLKSNDFAKRCEQSGFWEIQFNSTLFVSRLRRYKLAVRSWPPQQIWLIINYIKSKVKEQWQVQNFENLWQKWAFPNKVAISQHKFLIFRHEVVILCPYFTMNSCNKVSTGSWYVELKSRGFTTK